MHKEEENNEPDVSLHVDGQVGPHITQTEILVAATWLSTVSSVEDGEACDRNRPQ